MSTTTWLAVEPLDTIMVRDGRGFDAGSASVAVASPPPPSTLGGVVCRAIGRDVRHHLVGPIVATHHDGPLFPLPQDVVQHKNGDVGRLGPIESRPGQTCDLGDALTHLLAGEGEHREGFFDGEAMAAWLNADGELAAGTTVTPGWWRMHGGRRPWRLESRVGLALRQEGTFAGTAEPGMLYAAAHLRPGDGTHFLVGCVDDVAVKPVTDLVPIGGRGRLASVSIVDKPGIPPAPQDFPGGRVAVYLATPALVDDLYWCPPGAKLCTIAVRGLQPVATASPRQGLWSTRRLCWAMPAGAVFYLDFGDADAAGVWAHAHHQGLWPGQARNVRMVTAGFGTCLTGRW